MAQSFPGYDVTFSGGEAWDTGNGSSPGDPAVIVRISPYPVARMGGPSIQRTVGIPYIRLF